MPSETKETRPAASDDEHETSRASDAKAAAYDERDAAPENVGPSSSPAFGEEQRAPAAPLALERARLVAQQGLHAHAEALRSIDPGLLASLNAPVLSKSRRLVYRSSSSSTFTWWANLATPRSTAGSNGDEAPRLTTRAYETKTCSRMRDCMRARSPR